MPTDRVTWDNRDRIDVHPALNGTVDWVSGGTGIYSWGPGAGTVVWLERANILIRDDAKFQGDGYGIGSALSTGITVRVTDDNGTAHTFTPSPVKTIGEWGLVAGVDVDYTDFTTGDDWFAVRWTFSRGGKMVCLQGDLNAQIEFDLPETISWLTYHVVQLQGTFD